MKFDLEDKELTIDGYTFVRKVTIDEEVFANKTIAHKVAVIYYMNGELIKTAVLPAGKYVTYEKVFIIPILKLYTKESVW